LILFDMQYFLCSAVSNIRYSRIGYHRIPRPSR
jgi:hypothetical protein